MDFKKPLQLSELADFLQCGFRGEAEHLTYGFNEIHRVRPGDLVFVDHPKYYQKALDSAATTIIINQEVEVPEGKGLLISEDPFRDFNRLTAEYFPFQARQASIAEDAEIGEGTILQPGCTIGHGVKIGKDCVIHANVNIADNCQLGDRVIIQANTVIGSDAFYYKKRAEGFDRLLSGGIVVIEDDVEIGASCTIDRGVSADTRIGKGSKFDNQVHVGHDTIIGEKCLFAAQVGVAGCTIIGNGVTLWGQVGVSSDITIGDKAVVLAQSGVSKSLAGGKVYFGYPADEARKRHREMASLRLLPEIINRIELEE
ncbi:UDP-3-O-(3-hydroxymyristoyl)glucosamine N-acyltransferase [Croceimicrobium sp.]|uniref:UDP-3-O-(3-hydroxymyristoyl)glucosamine N-acyltransferase n=1 Tax=Croceimicrobium sp. TaxID=2828340 RepID=UPI003BAB22AE